MKEVTEELAIATENLYRVFARYPYSSDMEICPCCTTKEDRHSLTSKTLRLLTGDDIGEYAFSAMTTWGDVYDFKHFLPRIFELKALDAVWTDTFVVLGKLEYANWRTWKKDEQDGVYDFILAWWQYSTKAKKYYDGHDFREFYKVIEDIDVMLTRWHVTLKDNSIRSYIEFVNDEFVNLFNYKGDLYKLLGRENVDKVIAWTMANKPRLQDAFFHFENTEPEMAQKASDVLYILEH